MTPTQHATRQFIANMYRLDRANTERSRRGSLKNVELAKQRIGYYTPSHPYFQALADRITHPEASLVQIAASRGQTKDAYASQLRRALTEYQRPRRRTSEYYAELARKSAAAKRARRQS